MKKVFLLAAAFMIGGAAYAQTGTTGTTKFGIKAGVNLPSYKYTNDALNESEDTESSVNFNVTGYADIPVSNFFSVQPGISLQGKGAKYRETENYMEKEDVLAIEIPVNLLANLPAGPGHFYLGAGPYAGFNISGKIDRDYDDGVVEADYDTDLNIGDDDGDDLKALDFGFNFLAGYQFNSGFNVGAGYGLGLTNLYPGSTSDTNIEKNNRLWSFTVGYAF